jgi:HlyD family secretion protein
MSFYRTAHQRNRAAMGVVCLVGLVLVVLLAARVWSKTPPDPQAPARAGRSDVFALARRDFVRTIRLSGTVEAIQSTTISTPRLSGPNTNSLVITRLVRAGSTVAVGDLIVEFDRQQQMSNALDRRAELADLEQQIRKREAQERAAAARDESEIQVAQSAIGRAEFEMLKNPMIAKINAEKNANALEQARATLQQLKTTFDLKRKAAEADVRILRIRRDRAENAMRQAETNADRMAIRAPIGGMAVLKTIWKANTMAEVQEGEEVRAGVPVVDIVNPQAMRARSRVNQADINDLRIGQPVRVGLDAYPELRFAGRVAQISPLGVTSTLSPKVRTFIVLIDVEGSHPNLMPDLTAALDVELSRAPGVLVVPRDALRYDGERVFVSVQNGSRFVDREVSVRTMSAHEAVIESGLDDGMAVMRNVANGRRP